MRPVLLAAAFASLAYLDTHTDEMPILLGSVLILAGLLAGLYPKDWLAVSLAVGSAVPFTEILVHYGILSAPWPTGTGFPYAPFIAYLPALIGVGIGAGIRNAAAPSTAT